MKKKSDHYKKIAQIYSERVHLVAPSMKPTNPGEKPRKNVKDEQMSAITAQLAQEWTNKTIPEALCQVYREFISQLPQRKALLFVPKEISDLRTYNSIGQICLKAIYAREESLQSIREMNEYLSKSKDWTSVIDIKLECAEVLHAHRMLTLNVAESIERWKDFFTFEIPDFKADFFHNGANYLEKMREDLDFLRYSELAKIFKFAPGSDPFLIGPSKIIEKKKGKAGNSSYFMHNGEVVIPLPSLIVKRVQKMEDFIRGNERIVRTSPKKTRIRSVSPNSVNKKIEEKKGDFEIAAKQIEIIVKTIIESLYREEINVQVDQVIQGQLNEFIAKQISIDFDAVIEPILLSIAEKAFSEVIGKQYFDEEKDQGNERKIVKEKSEEKFAAGEYKEIEKNKEKEKDEESLRKKKVDEKRIEEKEKKRIEDEEKKRIEEEEKKRIEEEEENYRRKQAERKMIEEEKEIEEKRKNESKKIEEKAEKKRQKQIEKQRAEEEAEREQKKRAENKIIEKKAEKERKVHAEEKKIEQEAEKEIEKQAENKRIKEKAEKEKEQQVEKKKAEEKAEKKLKTQIEKKKAEEELLKKKTNEKIAKKKEKEEKKIAFAEKNRFDQEAEKKRLDDEAKAKKQKNQELKRQKEENDKEAEKKKKAEESERQQKVEEKRASDQKVLSDEKKRIFDEKRKLEQEKQQELDRKSSKNALRLQNFVIYESIIRSYIESQLDSLNLEKLASKTLKEIVDSLSKTANNKEKQRLSLVLQNMAEEELQENLLNWILDEFIKGDWIEQLASNQLVSPYIKERRLTLEPLRELRPGLVIEDALDYVIEVFTPGAHSPNEVQSPANEEEEESFQSFQEDPLVRVMSEGKNSGKYEIIPMGESIKTIEKAMEEYYSSLHKTISDCCLPPIDLIKSTHIAEDSSWYWYRDNIDIVGCLVFSYHEFDSKKISIVHHISTINLSLFPGFLKKAQIFFTQLGFSKVIVQFSQSLPKEIGSFFKGFAVSNMHWGEKSLVTLTLPVDNKKGDLESGHYSFAITAETIMKLRMDPVGVDNSTMVEMIQVGSRHSLLNCILKSFGETALEDLKLPSMTSVRLQRDILEMIEIISTSDPFEYPYMRYSQSGNTFSSALDLNLHWTGASYFPYEYCNATYKYIHLPQSKLRKGEGNSLLYTVSTSTSGLTAFFLIYSDISKELNTELKGFKTDLFYKIDNILKSIDGEEIEEEVYFPGFAKQVEWDIMWMHGFEIPQQESGEQDKYVENCIEKVNIRMDFPKQANGLLKCPQSKMITDEFVFGVIDENIDKILELPLFACLVQQSNWVKC